jgi:uncharacterized protein (DUF2344 family)
MRSNDNDDFNNFYQEEIGGCQSFTAPNKTWLIELATRNVELMSEEPGPLKKRLHMSQRIIERQQSIIEDEKRREQLHACVSEATFDPSDCW